MSRARDVQDKLDLMTPEKVQFIAAMFVAPADLKGSGRMDVYRDAMLESLPKGKAKRRQRLARMRECLSSYQRALQDSLSRYGELRREGPAVLSDYVLTVDYGLDVEQAMLWTLTALESSIKHDLTRVAILMDEIGRLQSEISGVQVNE